MLHPHQYDTDTTTFFPVLPYKDRRCKLEVVVLEFFFLSTTYTQKSAHVLKVTVGIF